ncbi:MAG: Universal stress protein family [Myxococcaceae bacterium]|nr:Universal stress protein family [Myxococcaceae bacterium]
MPSPVLIATDLTEHAEPALVRGRALARAIGAPWMVIHVVPDVLHHHPLLPAPRENDAVIALELERKAGGLVEAQVRRVLDVSPDEYRVAIEVGDAEDEIVRVAEEERASLILVGAKPRHGSERVLGHVAERVVRYAHTTVIVARAGASTRKLLVATDFTEGALPALRFAAMIVEKMGFDATLIHVMELPRVTLLTPVFSALGSPWTPPSKAAIEQLEELGRKMLEGFADEYHFAHTEQVEGDPRKMLIARAEALGAELIVMGSHNPSGLPRLVLGSVAEAVIRSSTLSVAVARG